MKRTTWLAAWTMAIWLACAPWTYLLLKSSWTKRHHASWNYSVIVENEWTVGARNAVLLPTLLGPFGLSIAIGAVVSDTLPDADQQQKAAW